MKLLAAALVITCGTAQGQGVDRSWTGAVSQLWYSPDNWNGPVWPGPDDRAVFTDAATRYTLDLQGGAAFNAMRFDTQNGYTLRLLSV